MKSINQWYNSNTHMITSKSLSRNVSCQCEPILVALACINIGFGRRGTGLTLRFIPEIVMFVQKRHLIKRMRDTSDTSNTSSTDPQETLTGCSRKEYIDTIQDLARADPNRFLR